MVDSSFQDKLLKKPFLTIHECALVLGCTDSRVYNLVHRNQLKCVDILGRKCIPTGAVKIAMAGGSYDAQPCPAPQVVAEGEGGDRDA